VGSASESRVEADRGVSTRHGSLDEECIGPVGLCDESFISSISACS
jgi:hypothetical protein